DAHRRRMALARLQRHLHRSRYLGPSRLHRECVPARPEGARRLRRSRRPPPAGRLRAAPPPAPNRLVHPLRRAPPGPPPPRRRTPIPLARLTRLIAWRSRAWPPGWAAGPDRLADDPPSLGDNPRVSEDI